MLNEEGAVLGHTIKMHSARVTSQGDHGYDLVMDYMVIFDKLSPLVNYMA
jgi:hypothetical protein